MGFPEKGSSYPDLKNNTIAAKTDRDKLKLFAKQLKSVFATKIELKDNNLEREIGNFLILKQRFCCLLNFLFASAQLLMLSATAFSRSLPRQEVKLSGLYHLVLLPASMNMKL